MRTTGVTARIGFSTTSTENEYTGAVERCTTATITVKADKAEVCIDLMYDIMKALESLHVGIRAFGGKVSLVNNRYEYTESFELHNHYGYITKYKEEIRQTFKDTKKALNIR